jgi:anti-sigma B factor antagonist
MGTGDRGLARVAAGAPAAAMSDPMFRVAVERAEGGVQVELRGELDVSTAPELQRHVEDLATGEGAVWIDCSELTFADSSGLDTLIRLAKTLRAQDRRLVLSNVRPIVRRAMEVLRITELFELR